MTTQTIVSMPPAQGVGFRRSLMSNDPSILTEIHKDQANIAIWQRDFPKELKHAAKLVVDHTPTLQISLSLSSENVYTPINQALGETPTSEVLSQDIAGLIDMFCCLFDLQRVGLKLTVLDHVMCPRFHADQVPCRLVTTYQGEATEWLPLQSGYLIMSLIAPSLAPAVEESRMRSRGCITVQIRLTSSKQGRSHS